MPQLAHGVCTPLPNVTARLWRIAIPVMTGIET